MNEYKKLADTFTAEDFDAEEIAKTAKASGCKYITLTTRHHEGFSLYDTCGLNDFDAPHTPAGRDLIREFVDACNKYGLMPMFYHTTLDWYNPDFDENFDEYLEYLRKSVETLCKNYGRPCGVAGIGKNFALKSTDGKSLYLFVYDLAIKGDDNVTVGGKYRGLMHSAVFRTKSNLLNGWIMTRNCHSFRATRCLLLTSQVSLTESHTP